MFVPGISTRPVHQPGNSLQVAGYRRTAKGLVGLGSASVWPMGSSVRVSGEGFRVEEALERRDELGRPRQVVTGSVVTPDAPTLTR